MSSHLEQVSIPHYEPGDCIEFKRYVSGNSDGEYVLTKGKIIDKIYKNNKNGENNIDYLEIQVYDPTKTNFNEKLDKTDLDKMVSKELDLCTIHINSIVNYYPSVLIPTLSLRLVLKDTWKDFVFREVKTVKTKDPYMITYQYLNENGFVRTMTYDTLEEAYQEVPENNHHNIKVHYGDYYGFTTSKPIRNNDIYCHHEIFFSKKCVGEIKLTGYNISGGFSLRRGFNNVPPTRNKYICGLIEMGEKGLFYRKWFPCSEEFLILWTMICEPDNHSLKNNTGWNYKTKSIEEILKSLDTSKYNTNILNPNPEGYKVHNIESVALYFPDIYQRIAKKIFKLTKRNDESVYISYEDQLEQDIIWMKKM
jgi:hypothetical protein